MSNSRLTYPELDSKEPSIRLLKKTGLMEAQGPMKFSLKTFKFSNIPNFTALSYCWGSPFNASGVDFIDYFRAMFADEDCHRMHEDRKLNWTSDAHLIVCNDKNVLVRLNLFEALKSWVLQEEEFLWVDALCINQDSNAEKSSQIKHMAKVYQKASRVRVWLSHSGYESKSIVRLLDEFTQLYNNYTNLVQLDEKEALEHDPCSLTYRQKWGFKDNCAALQASTWVAFGDICGRSWFNRRWVLQEVALARSVVVACGADTFDWEKLRFLVEYIDLTKWHFYFVDVLFRNSQFVPTRRVATAFRPQHAVNYALGTYRDTWHKACLETNGDFNAAAILTELLYLCIRLEVSDTRDAIFAIYGLVHVILGSDEQSLVQVDYSLGVAELLRRVTEMCLRHVPSLAFLSLVTNSHLNDPSMRLSPSWVPRLAASMRLGTNPKLGLKRGDLVELKYNVAFEPGPAPVRQIDGNELLLRGHYIGTTCYRTRAGWLPESQYLYFMEQLPAIVRGVHAIEALWRTTIIDRELTTHPAPADLGDCFHDYIIHRYLQGTETAKDELEHNFERIGRIAQTLSHSNTQLPYIPKDDPRYSYLTHPGALNDLRILSKLCLDMGKVSRMSVLTVDWLEYYKTDRGDIGRGPASQRVGDQIWVLENGRVPFILRPVSKLERGDKNKKTFTLIEECFCYGVMNGELKDEMLFEDICII